MRRLSNPSQDAHLKNKPPDFLLPSTLPSHIPLHCQKKETPRVCVSSNLCLPNTLDSLRDTDVVCLKLVQTNAYSQGGGVQSPPEQLAQTGVSLLGDVVDDDGLETDVGMDEDGGAEDRVHGGVEGAGSEGRDG